MLNGVLRLHGVDAERLAAQVMHDTVSRQGTKLSECAREDLLAELVSYTWELSLRYDPNQDHAQDRGRRPGFDGWATYYLRFKVIDWFRKPINGTGRVKWQFGPDAQHLKGAFRQSGGTHERTLPEVRSLDGLDEAEQPWSMDPSERSEIDLGRVLLRGDSEEAWDAAGVDREDDGRVEERAA